MARIEGVPLKRAGFLTRLIYRFAERKVGKIPEPMMIMAHNPRIFDAVVGFEFFIDRARRVPKSIKTLGCLQAAMSIGCVF
jgi:hypothetical protein